VKLAREGGSAHTALVAGDDRRRRVYRHKPVEADALAVARGRQEVKPGWAKAFRARHKKA
jgi:hypothetical protein